MSLKQHIGVLGILALVTLLWGMGVGVVALQQTESARVTGATGLMTGAVDQLTRRYEYLRDSFEERQAVDPLRSDSDELLRSLTEATLAGFPGVEGGFYAIRAERLLAYAYPTYSGSGPKTDIPTAERPTIQRVAASAVGGRGSAEERIAAGTDLLLFQARALLDHGEPVGAIWVMYRLNGIRNGYQALYTIGLIGMLILSVIVAALAWLLTRRLDRGVAKVERGLLVMEEYLDAHVPMVGILELDRVGAAINRLGSSLLDNQTRRAELDLRLRQADRLAVLGRLVAGVAHELRNPLASVKLKLQLMRRDSLSQFMPAFDIIDAEIARMNRLVERLLLLAKPSHASRTPTDVSGFIRERAALWRERASDQSVLLECHSDENMATAVLVDRDQLGQIIDNLIANALEALHSHGGGIRFDVTRRPKTILLAVTDTGPGVPSDVAPHLFEPFFTTRTGGTGLGLFLSAELAHALGGELRYCERLEGGARFELTFPC
ncbi:MAG: sensor histidine kinase [Nitrospiraceae bacterium]